MTNVFSVEKTGVGGKAFAAKGPVDACDENLPSTAVHLPLAMIELVCRTFVHTAVVDIF